MACATDGRSAVRLAIATRRLAVALAAGRASGAGLSGARLVNDLDAARHSDGAEGPRDRSVALLVNGGVAGADVDRVMAGGAVLADHAALLQRQRVVTAADDDFTLACDVDRIVTIAGDYGSTAEDRDVNIAATRNTDSCH